ncbi:putative target of rapamycin (TOR) kinase 1 [Trypanosoma cruzi]|uniref:Putative target of rapamycin (TOR) kinase 1 n=1 Tax=Trypanosoma cruzi TaxID=5693 RepID=A0A2V2XK50_TRYCR|nr:putative target of rapamycin (TOR) kinase 1 [Trypanosoma cruzi]RNC42194.1 protein kinase [Trypanosoma cruzi]
MGEDRESGATQYTFLGVQFDHTLQAVSLSEKFVRPVCAMPSLKYLTIAEMEVMASRFLYAAAIFGTRLCDYYFFIKAVQQRLSALNRGIVLETSPANVPSAAVGLGEGLRHIIENTIVSESSIPRKSHRPPSSRMRRSMDGEPFSFQTPATLKLPEGNGRRSLFLSCRPRRAVRLALSAFSAILPSTMDVWVDNTSPQGAANKGSPKSHALTWELQRI